MLPWEAVLGTVLSASMALTDMKKHILHCDRVEGKVQVHTGKTSIRRESHPQCALMLLWPSRILLLLVFVPVWISQMDGTGPRFANHTAWELVEPEGGEGPLHVPGPVGVCQRPAQAEQGQLGGDGQPLRGWGHWGWGALGPRGRRFWSGRSLPNQV